MYAARRFRRSTCEFNAKSETPRVSAKPRSQVLNRDDTPLNDLHFMRKTRKVVFNVSRSYEIKEILGEGAYGIVASATHKPTGLAVAIKKIEPFSKSLICLRTIRELFLLNFFRNHENIIGFYDIQRPSNYDAFNEVYLVQEYMPTDLHKLIHALVLLDQHIQYFVYQMLRALKTIHSANVIHRDLKPSNVLVDFDCGLKICDFGLARIIGSDSLPLESNLTEYVATRWYRAPEIMLLQSSYSTAVDLWSIGCMMAEIFMGYPLFPGKDYKHQLQLIFLILGTPTGDDLTCVKLARARAYIQLMNFCRGVDLGDYISNHPKRMSRYGIEPVNPLGLDLMKRLLSFRPEDRPSAELALQHPYLSQYHDPNDEPTSAVALEPGYFDQQCKSDLTVKELKKYLYDEILNMTKSSKRVK